ncbi:MAG: lysophospholipid acyltransferase family protein [Rhodoglobus sp.]
MTTPGKSRPEKTAIFRFCAGLVKPVMYIVGRYRVRGAENVPATGAFVLAPNHYSNIDPLVIALAVYNIGRMPRYLAKASLFRIPIIGYLLTKTGQIPVERSGRSASDPLDQARRIAEEGLAVVIYPEGTLTREPDYWPMRGKFGAVRTALASGVPLIPAASWGAQLILPRYSKRINFFPRATATTIFGKPVDLSEFAGKPLDGPTLAAATDKLMDAITALLEELRGEKAPAERWNPTKHGQSEMGNFEKDRPLGG